jgi:serine/threonine protein phosphatase PrpC
MAIVCGNKLYVANAGDCKGVLLSKNEAGDLTHRVISTTFCANKKYE